MEVSFAPKSEVWRGRGHPRREVPEAVRMMADRTYRTGQVGEVTVNADEETEIIELRRLLISYAKSKGRRMRIQREGDTFRFEMVDVQRVRA